ncbi:MAG: restriction endonuclease [Balneolaceae bacterium]|nr:restriction endonuclease [Balneolaceae bacterium]
MTNVHVTKASGELEPFDETKLRRSLKNAGASETVINSIAHSIRDKLVEEISTQKIYREAFRLLRAESQRAAGRYKLKEAIFELGPTGFPFEQFVGELLAGFGYSTEVGVSVKGDCVQHEIDVIAQKENEYLLVECKFHNKKENRCNIQVPLYIQSRFLDIKRNWTSLPGHENKIHKGMVVTNTRFTSDAETYAECVGLELLSWDYPENNGIRDLIGRLGLHPVTCLSTLTDGDKEKLLDSKVIFCKQICRNKRVLNEAGIDERRINRIAKEANEVCNSNSYKL